MNEVLLGPLGRRLLQGYGWLLLVFVIAPAVILIPISFSGGSVFAFPPQVLSLEWYDRLVDDPRWRDAALLSLKVAGFASVLAVILGTQAAIALSRVAPRHARYLKLLFISPMIVPLMVIGVGFYVVFARIHLLGGFLSLGLAHTVLVLPFVILPVTARLMSLDSVLERAAASLGAGPFPALYRVILPLLAPAILAGFVFAFIFSFDEVVVAQFLSGATLETLPRLMWEGISVGGLDKTITAVTTVQIAIAVGTILIIQAWQRRPQRLAAMAMPAESSDPESGSEEGPAGSRPGQIVKRDFGGGPGKKSGEKSRRGEARGVGIVFDHLTKRYGDHAAVDEVDLKVEPGEFLTLLGPSGSGKTTLLMLIAGFVAPDSGRLLLGNRDISAIPPHRRDIGVVFQNYALFPHLDVRRNVAFPLEVRGARASETKREVDWALNLVHMEAFAGRRVSQLSGGQQQRVALARAIVFGPRALLMDEPLAALDRNLRLDMQGEIRSLQRSLGQTVVYVTHDQEEALNLSDRVAVMHGGRLQQVDSPRDLYLKPRNAFVAGFFGEANLFRGTGQGEALTLAGGQKLPLPRAQLGPAVLCVRPELVQLGAPATSSFPVIEGRVTEARFQGSIVRILLETALGPMVATRQITSAAAVPEAGAAVRISWAPPLTHVMEG
jgi:ABC-type Fe3+/spermidine/putrescine transport system ATPase subunit/ABC-type spermidine/putrescine transport system permease subunit II